MDNKYYTIKETAELLNISNKLIYKLISYNEFPYVKIGSRFLIPSSLLEDYIEKQTKDFSCKK
jgi:excisionase family DNA binding protein